MKTTLDALHELFARLGVTKPEAKTTSGTFRRESLAAILETVERDGLKGPRDLDVALDAIEALFDVSTP